ncbi:MAG: ABC transporter ATP-binding protein, ATP-binding cassette, subfamily B, bacterial [Candidatus Peregrinibacteria bacterium GW2011_GWF2_33_10]|nr:MAG: ABC transporter ATP-binding protein, ATP-binding cassette, subfamily B, bacterial [Candidatus Peregrinibacteria bacterium GW2011_GWF2_33_10]
MMIDGIQAAFMMGFEVLILYIALKLWQKGIFTIGDFVLIQSYVFQLMDRLWNFGRIIRDIYRALADGEDMIEILYNEHEIKDLPNAKILKVDKGLIEFKNVCFGYNKKDFVFDRFSLQIKAGEKVAIVGRSGEGKTTLVKMLLRFYDLNDGIIEIDKQDIKKVTQDTLRESISLVPQEPILFHRTIFENIKYAKSEALDEEVYQASKLAFADDFIQKLPDKYETYVGERGIKLSGGERQRVAIARAILKNAPILILDEATSSLDSGAEKMIQEALKTLLRNKTSIVIAHRLSTIMSMDRIIIIENGKVIEQGKHEELLSHKGRYFDLWSTQVRGFIE